ncbi:MAG: CbiX/SirB N-terminal domain-containing protein [Candidatus Krumholzibacteriia bacterium]
MKALLLVAHGSRRPEANEEVRRLAAAVRRRATGFGAVKVAFLEFTEPTVAEGLEACIAMGATQVTVFPYLLSMGSHVAADIPRAVAARQKAHPEALIRVAPHLGLAEGLAELIVSHLEPRPDR